MSKIYERIVRRYYPKFYTKDDVMIFVKAGKLTEEEYNDIVVTEEEVPVIEVVEPAPIEEEPSEVLN